MRKYYVLAFSAAALLTGCVINPPKPAPPPVPTVQGVQAYNISKSVLAGQTLTVAHSISLNPDCTSRGFATLRIVQPPAHGVANIVTRNDYPSFYGKNPRAECDKQKHPGRFVDYVPENGFVGQDFLIVEHIGLTGEDKMLRITITVK